MRQAVLTLMLLGAAAARAPAQDVIDTFTNGTNSGGWSFGGPDELISPTGGNPGYYLRSSGLDTTIPWLRCTGGSLFTGDFRQMGVVGASIDVNVFSTDFNIGPFPVTLILYSDNGTPGNANDDWAVYLPGAGLPTPGSGWKHIDFTIPSQSTSLPAGWGYMQFGPGSPPSADWNAAITHVTRLEFSYGDPSLFYIFQMWTVGADNIRLAVPAPCYANCDRSTAPPILNANDFQCFMNRWAAGDSYANCDQSWSPPILNVNDFVCFMQTFAAGCS